MDNTGKKQLSEYYNKKYSAEGVLTPPDIVMKKYPRNRFEATIRWVEPGRRLLDIGAGSGSIVKALRSKFEECIATEIAEPRIKALKNYFAHDSHIKILQHDIESQVLPFPHEYFDTVLLIDVIEHVIDPVSVLREINRVLVRGGKLYMHTPNIAKWTRRIKLLFGYFPSTASMREGFTQYQTKEPTCLYDEGHLHYFTFRSLTRLLKERAHFSAVIRRGYGPLKILCELWPTLLSDVVLIAIK